MATTASLSPTPPEPGRKTKRTPRSEALWILGLLPLFWRRRFPIVLRDAQMVELNIIWASPHVWQRLPEALPEAGWHSCYVGFAVLAFRMDV